ncbi:hypothetical protein AB1Y20_007934 [Prymnesium parvum]|uniref:Myb-like domain-containing protein n=1 Tax=Prymnesium parvum TaxID=97485 RepID=A0AB34IUX0_PRYPA
MNTWVVLRPEAGKRTKLPPWAADEDRELRRRMKRSVGVRRDELWTELELVWKQHSSWPNRTAVALRSRAQRLGTGDGTVAVRAGATAPPPSCPSDLRPSAPSLPPQLQQHALSGRLDGACPFLPMQLATPMPVMMWTHPLYAIVVPMPCPDLISAEDTTLPPAASPASAMPPNLPEGPSAPLPDDNPVAVDATGTEEYSKHTRFYHKLAIHRS